MKFILALQDWNNMVYICIVHHTCTKHAFEGQALFVYQSIFVGIILEISGNLILNQYLSWKVISYSWKKRIEAL